MFPNKIDVEPVLGKWYYKNDFKDEYNDETAHHRLLKYTNTETFMVAGYPYGPWRLVDEATYIEGFLKDNRLMEVIGQNMVTKGFFDLEIYVSQGSRIRTAGW